MNPDLEAWRNLGEGDPPIRTVLSLWRGVLTIGPETTTPPTVLAIQNAVAAHYRLTRLELISDRRAREVARPRQVGIWLAKKLTTRSLPDIGRRFGGRDHTTVIHAVRRVDQLRADDPGIARDIAILLESLGGFPL